VFYYCAVRPSFQEGREKGSVCEVVEYGEKTGRKKMSTWIENIEKN